MNTLYLKSAVVGMNNNELSLTNKQAMLAKMLSYTSHQTNSFPKLAEHLTARYKKFYDTL